MKNSFLLLGVFLIVNFAFSQAPEIEWQRAYGGENHDIAYDLKSTSDGGFVLAGYTNSDSGDVSGNQGDFDIWIVKINSSGNIQWQKTYGGSDEEMLSSINETSDHGFIFTGYSNSSDGDLPVNNGGSDLWVVKLDNEGVIQWQKSLGSENHDTGNSVYQTADGGYIIGGITGGNHSNIPYSGWILKLNSDGEIQWEKIYNPEPGERTIQSIIQADEGNYLFIGTIFTSETASDAWIGKLDEAGELLWEKIYGGSSHDYLTSLQITPEGGIILAGSTYSSDGDIPGNNGESDFWVLKLDENGNKEWSKTLGGSDYDDGHSIIQTTDGGYLTVGETSSNDGDVSGLNGETAAWLVKLDSNGNLEWQKPYGNGHWQGVSTVVERSPNQYSFGGYTYSEEVPNYHGNSDFWLVSLFPEELSIDNFEINKIVAYPNPVKTILKLSEPMKEIQIFDLSGKRIANVKNSSHIDLSKFTKGVYILKGISSKGQKIHQKILKD